MPLPLSPDLKVAVKKSINPATRADLALCALVGTFDKFKAKGGANLVSWLAAGGTDIYSAGTRAFCTLQLLSLSYDPVKRR